LGLFTFSIVATDADGTISKIQHELWVVPFNGKGTEEDPYQISTLTGLNFVRNLPDMNYMLMNDLDFSGSIYDSTNSNIGWIPIGNDTAIFRGAFEGAGHVINNLYVNNSQDACAGLFG
jgi:hypothetical protein